MSHGTNLRIPAYVSLAVGAVAGGLGGYFLWQSSDYESQSNALFACDKQPLGCSVTDRAKIRGLEADSSSAKTRAVVAFGVGGAAIVTGIVLLAVSGSSSSSDAPVTAWVGPREVGLSGRF